MNRRARTAEEYYDLVKQAIFELQDIKEAAGFAFDEVSDNLGYVDVLLKELQQLRAGMQDGSYTFGRQDLPMMRVVKRYTQRELPCIHLFYQINSTHREGLDIDPEN